MYNDVTIVGTFYRDDSKFFLNMFHNDTVFFFQKCTMLVEDVPCTMMRLCVFFFFWMYLGDFMSKTWHYHSTFYKWGELTTNNASRKHD